MRILTQFKEKKKELWKFLPKDVMFGAAEPFCEMTSQGQTSTAKDGRVEDGKNLGSITSSPSSGNSISELQVMQDSKCPLKAISSFGSKVFIICCPKTPKEGSEKTKQRY